jgi:hypothetical protein
MIEQREKTINDESWWPSILWPLAKEYGPDRVRRIGIQVLGYPPDVFGIHFDDLRKLQTALLQPS